MSLVFPDWRTAGDPTPEAWLQADLKVRLYMSSGGPEGPPLRVVFLMRMRVTMAVLVAMIVVVHQFLWHVGKQLA